MSSWFTEGNVAVVNGSTVVTGTNTKFSNCRAGDMFVGPDSAIYQVTNPSSDTAVSISPAYRGASAAGAGYGIVPVNGYPKALADAVNQMVQQWGATLAGLGSVASENIVPTAKGGTGNATGTAPKLAPSAMVGAVSQSGGIPTGALMEYGSNATGEYWKFANGLMVSSQHIQLGPLTWSAGTGIRFVQITAGLPVTFAANPLLYTQMRDGNVSSRSAWCTIAVAPTPGTLDAWFASTPTTIGTGGFGVNVFAIGRWFI
jgi:hypothetical protein